MPLTEDQKTALAVNAAGALGHAIAALRLHLPAFRAGLRPAELAAKEALARHLRGRSITITRCEPETGRCEDRYRRTLARLSTPAGDIGAALVASGHALPWRPGPDAARARAQHWCGRER